MLFQLEMLYLFSHASDKTGILLNGVQRLQYNPQIYQHNIHYCMMAIIGTQTYANIVPIER